MAASAFDSAAFASNAFDSYALKVNAFYLYNDQKKFPTKRKIEKLVFSVDFTPILSPGELIESVEWAVIPVGHAGETIGMISGPSIADENIIKQLIVGGESDKNYVACCVVSTSNNQVLTLPPVGKGIFTVSDE